MAMSLVSVLTLVASVAAIELPIGASQQASAQREPGIYYGSDVVTFRFGFSQRELPFRLNIERADAPRTLREMVDKIYNALPETRLEMFAAYHGGRNFQQFRSRYDSTIDFYRDLYMSEILHEAARIWDFDEAEFPLARARECVGRTFVSQVALQIGVRYLDRQDQEGAGSDSDVEAGSRTADSISRRLFEVCDTRNDPGQ